MHFFWVFNNSPSRDRILVFFAPPFLGQNPGPPRPPQNTPPKHPPRPPQNTPPNPPWTIQSDIYRAGICLPEGAITGGPEDPPNTPLLDPPWDPPGGPPRAPGGNFPGGEISRGGGFSRGGGISGRDGGPPVNPPSSPLRGLLISGPPKGVPPIPLTRDQSDEHRAVRLSKPDASSSSSSMSSRARANVYIGVRRCSTSVSIRRWSPQIDGERQPESIEVGTVVEYSVQRERSPTRVVASVASEQGRSVDRAGRR